MVRVLQGCGQVLSNGLVVVDCTMGTGEDAVVRLQPGHETVRIRDQEKTSLKKSDSGMISSG